MKCSDCDRETNIIVGSRCPECVDIAVTNVYTAQAARSAAISAAERKVVECADALSEVILDCNKRGSHTWNEINDANQPLVAAFRDLRDLRELRGRA